MLDTIIVGAGIAGLYYAHINKTRENCIILEKSSRVGGRVGQVLFNGVKVVTGAGIGRYDKDRFLETF